jgi:predicted SAM-dependent methyltransferase
MAETSKAFNRRVREGFFERYVKAPVIDIGVGRIDTHDGADPLTNDCDTWDKDNGNAEHMFGVADESYMTVYTSHLLEHLNEPILAIQNWFRILKKGGYLIISVPHRDLYERKKTLPSNWNGDHKFFILPDTEEAPHTRSFRHLIEQALDGKNYKIKELKVQNTCTNVDKPHEHGNGEYSIEAIIYKKIRR